MEKPELIVLVGPPGSGKSTLARSMVTPERVIVSRDGIRAMLTELNSDEYWKQTWRDFEMLVSYTHYSLIQNFLRQNISVISDCCHTQQEHIDPYLTWMMPFHLRFIIMQTTREQCLINNRERVRKVTELLINRMYDQFMVLLDSCSYFDEYSTMYDPIKVCTLI